MDTPATEPRDDAEPEPVQAFQAEAGEHRSSAPATPSRRDDPDPAAAYQHED